MAHPMPIVLKAIRGRPRQFSFILSDKALCYVLVEVIEAENPLEVLDYEFVPDTGGAGKFRGGMSQRKTWRMLADEGILQCALIGRRTGHTGCRAAAPAPRDATCSIPGCPPRRSCTRS